MTLFAFVPRWPAEVEPNIYFQLKYEFDILETDLEPGLCEYSIDVCGETAAWLYVHKRSGLLSHLGCTSQSYATLLERLVDAAAMSLYAVCIHPFAEVEECHETENIARRVLIGLGWVQFPNNALRAHSMASSSDLGLPKNLFSSA